MSRSSIVIIGSSDMLGRELLAECKRRDMDVCAFAGRKDLDITNADAVRDALRNKAPAVVVNAAGYTDVDRAEAEPGAADQVNRTGPAHIAEVCSEIGALLVHYSTDYVFDGRADRPYRVGDTPRPINTYGSTKLYRGGLKVYTTLNMDFQEIAQKAVRENILKSDKRYGYRGPLGKVDLTLNPLAVQTTLRELNDFQEQEEMGVEPGTIIKGAVLEVTDDDVLVELGKDEGIIELKDMHWARKPNTRIDGRWAKIASDE